MAENGLRARDGKSLTSTLGEMSPETPAAVTRKCLLLLRDSGFNAHTARERIRELNPEATSLNDLSDDELTVFYLRLDERKLRALIDAALKNDACRDAILDLCPTLPNDRNELERVRVAIGQMIEFVETAEYFVVDRLAGVCTKWVSPPSRTDLAFEYLSIRERVAYQLWNTFFLISTRRYWKESRPSTNRLAGASTTNVTKCESRLGVQRRSWSLD